MCVRVCVCVYDMCTAQHLPVIARRVISVHLVLLLDVLLACQQLHRGQVPGLEYYSTPGLVRTSTWRKPSLVTCVMIVACIKAELVIPA